jgi:hypothetical protein
MGRQIKFYMDEHVGRAVVRGLNHRGADVLTVRDAGLLGASDKEHLQRAFSEGRVLFTQDDDFLRLHAAGVEHAGIVYAPQGTSIGKIIRGLMLVNQLLDAHEMSGHVEYLIGTIVVVLSKGTEALGRHLRGAFSEIWDA